MTKFESPIVIERKLPSFWEQGSFIDVALRYIYIYVYKKKNNYEYITLRAEEMAETDVERRRKKRDT